MANSMYSLSFLDYDGQSSNFSVNLTDLTVLNIPDVLVELGTLKNAFDGISIGQLKQTVLVWDIDKVAAPGQKASSNLAQRSNKWLVRYYDNVTKAVFSVEVPCADLSLKTEHSDRVDLTTPANGSAWATLKSAFEQTVKSPYGNAVTLLEAIAVGRAI